ncbi:MAG TPA: copper resistance protein CopC [Chloroflexia bacterium]|nr:copper resistance protein CopC [Chloroflexia bacterium]
MQRLSSVPARILLTLAALLLLSVISVGRASAHAHLESSNPADGAILTSEPATISAVYGEETSLTKTTFEVYFSKDAGSTGQKVADGKVDVNVRTNVSASLPAGLGDGVYTVKWHTLTEDDNGMADGVFSFTVGGSGTSSGSAGGTTTGSGGSTLPTTGEADTLAWLTLLLAGFILLCGGVAVRGRSQS